MRSELVFLEESHEYFTEDGRKFRSVSEFVKPLSELPDGGTCSNNLELAVEAAAERGVVCHKLIEILLNGVDINGEYPDAYEPYVESIELFFSEHEILPIYTETPFYSEELGIAGTPDLICVFDGETAIIDYKFVARIEKTKVKAQLNAYRMICFENGIEIDALYAVQFLPDVKYLLYPVSIDSAEIDALNGLWEIKTKKHPRGRID